jgi:hypothetical protein
MTSIPLKGISVNTDHQSVCFQPMRITVTDQTYRVFHFKVSILAPRLDLQSKSQQILTLARARSIWDFQPLGTTARAMPVDFSDALDLKPVR